MKSLKRTYEGLANYATEIVGQEEVLKMREFEKGRKN